MKKDSFGYRHTNHAVGIAHVHLVWVPKRRKSVLVGDVKLRLSELIDLTSQEKGWIIKAKEIAPDHVHLMVEFDSTVPISMIVKTIKGRSSRILREEFPHLKRLPSLWTKSYFYDTSGKVSTAKIMSYIMDPHHDKH